MKLPIPSTCCCCCTLKQGSLVIAWFSLVGAVLNILNVAKEVAVRGDVERMVEQDLYDHCDAACRDFVHKFVLSTMIISFILNSVVLILSILLILGINKKRPQLMTPYLVYMIISLILIVIVWIGALFLLYQVPVACVVFTIGIGLAFALEYHFVCVIYGHQQEIVAELTNTHIPLTFDDPGHQRVVI